MPYDVILKAKNAGIKEVEYTVIASPVQKPLIAEVQKQRAGNEAD